MNGKDQNEISKLNGGNNKNGNKFIVMDIVFYGNSLNYDWGGGANYQPLKKITKWDGRQYVLVSRYALRYSLLNWVNKLFPKTWKLAGSNVLKIEKGDVVKIDIFKKENGSLKLDVDRLKQIFNSYPEFDLFGFMVAEREGGQAALTRVSPVKISHAISMTPYNFDMHTMANLGMMRRADPTGQSGSNPVNLEEKYDFYVYNITMDVDRIGKFLKEEHGREEIGDIKIDDARVKERIIELVQAVLNLKRDIKGRREDLSPWVIILGLYKDGNYESYLNKIRLSKETHYSIEVTKKKEGDKEIIEHNIKDDLIPSFFIDLNKKGNVKVFYRKNLCEVVPDPENKLESKEDVLEEIKTFLEE